MTEMLKRLDDAGAETAEALERFMNNESLYVKFLTELPTEKTMPELVAAMDAKDYEKAKIAAHTLKGIAANLGLVNLMDCAMDVLTDLRENAPAAAEADMPALQSAYDEIVSVITACD